MLGVLVVLLMHLLQHALDVLHLIVEGLVVALLGTALNFGNSLITAY